MEYHLKTEGIITLAAMLGVLVFYSYITWKWYGKRRIKDIEPVSEIPKNISPMMAALADGIKDATEIVYIGMLSLIEKGFIKVEDSIFDIIFSILICLHKNNQLNPNFKLLYFLNNSNLKNKNSLNIILSQLSITI